METIETRVLIGVLAVAVIVVLVAGVFVAIAAYRRRTAKVARDRILRYLEGIDKTMVTLEAIRGHIGKGYSDQFLQTLPDYFPDELRKAVLKDKQTGALAVPGLARIRRGQPVVETDSAEVAA